MNGYVRALLFLAFASIASLSLAQNAELSTVNAYELKVPLVDYLGQPGLYQQAVFQSQPGSNDWKLQRFVKGVPLKFINSVDVVATSDFPIQVFLKVTGYIGGCEVMGDIAVRRDGNMFIVYAYYDDSSIHLGPDVNCVAAVWMFHKMVPLPVYGLKAGQYSYNVNGKSGGQFTLNADNLFADPGLPEIKIGIAQ